MASSPILYLFKAARRPFYREEDLQLLAMGVLPPWSDPRASSSPAMEQHDDS